MFLKCFKKVGIAGIAQFFLHLCNRVAFPEQGLGRGYFLQGNVVADRSVCVLFEQTGQIVGMQIKMICKGGNGQVFTDMFLNIGNHFVGSFLPGRDGEILIAFRRKAVHHFV